MRRAKLGEILRNKGFVRVMEVHNGISALIANDVQVEADTDSGIIREFDALWGSGFTDSASKGLPDVELVSQDSRLSTIQEIINVTDKPIIVDGDTGGNFENFEFFVHRLERMGVSAVIIEDKKYPKRCSLDADARQELENIDVFSEKIQRGKKILISNDFMIIARIESIIAGYSVSDALMRAREYVRYADGIMIHSKDKSPEAVLRFAEGYDRICEDYAVRKPLVCVPTTYNMVIEKELRDAGFNIVIYANHSLRASYKAMETVCKTILEHGRSFEAIQYCAPVSTIFNVVGFTEIKKKDMETMKKRSKAKVITLDLGLESTKEICGDLPLPLLEINGKSIIRRQLDSLKRCHITDVVVAGSGNFDVESVKYCNVGDSKDLLQCISLLKPEMKQGFILVFSHILFDDSIMRRLLTTRGDIVIAADSSYPSYRNEADDVNLVVAKNKPPYREFLSEMEKEVFAIGCVVRRDTATHEFIGIAKFSPRGAETLIQACERAQGREMVQKSAREKVSFTDLLQEMITKGVTVNLVETFKGWIEITHKKNYELAKKMVF